MFRILIHYLVIISVALSDTVSKTITLNDGNKMPILSLGTLGKLENIGLIKQAVITAIEWGYRQIDSAPFYQSEGPIGEAIADVVSRGIVTRQELWITTKLNYTVGNREGVIPSLQLSIKKLKVDYVDLFLIHTPDNWGKVSEYNYINIWKGMEDAKKLNLTRSIGVSNFYSSDINKILVNCDIVPAVNEIEVNPSFTNLDLVSYCQSLNITVLSYAPFGYMIDRPFENNPRPITFQEPVLMDLAKKYGKSTSQIVLRYLIDRGTVPIPTSVNTDRIKLNIDLFDFSLTQKEIFLINELNRNAKVFIFDDTVFVRLYSYYQLM